MSLAWFADPDTRFLGASIGQPNDWAALAVDLSPYGEDLTPNLTSGSGSGHAHEENHAATRGLLSDRCVEMLCTMRETSNVAGAVTVRDPSEASFNPSVVWYVMKSTGASALQCRLGSGTAPFVAVQLAPPSLSPVAQRYYVAWSDEANPDTTGPSDARRSTLCIWNLATDEYASATANHPAPGHNPDPSTLLAGALSVAGGSNNWAFDGQSIEMLRISDRPRSRQEIEAYIPAVLASFPRQGHIWAAKQGTRFFGIRSLEQGFDVLAQDRSQRRQDMSHGASWLYEDASETRYDFTAPRTLALVVDHDGSGYLWTRRNEHMRFVDPETLRVSQSATLLDMAMPLRGRLLLAWVSIPNPDTTGASDAVLSWLVVTDGETVLRESFTHSDFAQAGETPVWGASSDAGADTYTGEIEAVWAGTSAQSLTEMALDHGFANAAELLTDTNPTPRPALPITEASGFGAEGEFYGPQTAWAARNTRNLVRRLWSPLWNERMRIVPTIDHAELDDHPFSLTVPGATDHRLVMGWHAVAPVPPGVSTAWVRIHVRVWSGVTTPTPVSVRVYSFNRPPIPGQQLLQPGEEPETLDVSWVGQVVPGTNPGEYVALGLLRLAVGQSGVHRGLTYMAVALALGEDHASTQTTVQIAAVHVVPTDAELGGVLPGGGLGF